MNLQNITLSVCDTARQVGAFIREQSSIFTKDKIQIKGLHDMVSYVDKTSEQMLIKRLSELLPESGFIAEESGESKKQRFNWIIDPLDGTTNFVHHLPIYSISIALIDQNELVMGVVYEINNDECFYTWKDAPAFLNGREIHVSPETNLDNSLLATGLPFHDFSKLKGYLTVFESLMRGSQGIRRCGSAAVDLAYVAAGRFEAYFEYALHPWDVAAGIFLVKQAGGFATSWSGKDDAIEGKEIVAGNKAIYTLLLERLSKEFY